MPPKASKSSSRKRAAEVPPAPQRRRPNFWQRLPRAAKAVGALATIGGALGAFAVGWVSWGLPYPALRPGYDNHIEEIVEKKVEAVDRKVSTVAVKADRNNFDQLETKLATLAVHESLLGAQLTAIKRDKAFANSYSLQNQAADIERHINSLRAQHGDVSKRLRDERGY